MKNNAPLRAAEDCFRTAGENGGRTTMTQIGSQRRRLSVARMLACPTSLVTVRAIISVILLTVFSAAANATCADMLAKLQDGQPAHATDVTAYVFNCPTFPGDAIFTGDVTVGTASQSRTLNLLGNLQVSGTVTCGSGCGGGGSGTGPWATNGSNITFTAGNVGIGTTSPAVSLDVRTGLMPQIGVAGTTSYLTMFTSDTWGPTLFWNPDQDMRFGRGGNGLYNTPGYVELMRIQSSTGYVGIGTPSPSYMLHVNGTAYATGAAGALSDIRDKQNVASLSIGALDMISRLRPVTFYWKAPKDEGMKGRQTGLIAQEVEKVLPSTILTAKDARKSKAIKYDELTAVLIRAVQEQQIEIRKLQLANKRLEARLASVERISQKKK